MGGGGGEEADRAEAAARRAAAPRGAAGGAAGPRVGARADGPPARGAETLLSAGTMVSDTMVRVAWP